MTPWAWVALVGLLLGGPAGAALALAAYWLLLFILGALAELTRHL